MREITLECKPSHAFPDCCPTNYHRPTEVRFTTIPLGERATLADSVDETLPTRQDGYHERRNTQDTLVVDFDRNILKTSLLLESLLALFKQKPLYLFWVPIWLLRGKSYLKKQVAERVQLDISILPYRNEVLKYLQTQRSIGRSIILATTVDTRIVHQIAEYLKLFDSVVDCNDLSKSPETFRRAPEGWLKKLSLCMETLRPLHWSKNILVFIPLFAAHRIEDANLLQKALLAFVALGCCASSGYLFNDLFDLSADRHHPSKRFRPFAAGDVPLSFALIMSPVLAVLGGILGMIVSQQFLLILLSYLLLTLSYSLFLKQIVLLDVIVLAGLYTIRLMAGSVATHIRLSPWLLAFSIFVFFSLALVKRYAELVAMNRIEGDSAKARAYESRDRELLAAMGISSGYLAVLVLALYISSGTAQTFYGHYELMWLFCPVLFYWLSYVWLVAHRGRMHHDPVVFAVSDRTSRILLLFILAIAVLSL